MLNKISMITARIDYLGNLRCQAEHELSGATILSDAPKDNQGNGEAFSPTDLLCASLAMCMLTIMGIAAKEHNIALKEIKADVTKVMASTPRRVSKIQINIQGDFTTWMEKEWIIMKKAADTCPVKQSIHPAIEVELEWSQN